MPVPGLSLASHISRDFLLDAPSAIPPSLAGPIRRRFAVLVGINNYIDHGIAPLQFCVNDVRALAKTLDALGYTTICLHDGAAEERLLPTRDNFEAELAAVCQAAHADDLIWTHFAGHGKLVDGAPVLLTRDTRVLNLAKRALPLRELEATLRSSAARRIVLTLDACHTGMATGRSITDDTFNRTVHDLATGFAVIAGSTAEQVAHEWNDTRHGVFTYYILDALSGKADRTGKGFVTVHDLSLHVLDALTTWSLKQGGLQQPTARTEALGDMILVDRRPTN